MAFLSPGRLLAAVEAWITGYRSEHYKVGIQMVSAQLVPTAVVHRVVTGQVLGL